jgi:hypothetical protein
MGSTARGASWCGTATPVPPPAADYRRCWALSTSSLGGACRAPGPTENSGPSENSTGVASMPEGLSEQRRTPCRKPVGDAPYYFILCPDIRALLRRPRRHLRRFVNIHNELADHTVAVRINPLTG